MEESTFWFSLWTSLAAICVAALIVTFNYAKDTNEKILRADSCIKVVTINGDSYGRALALCGLLEKQKEQ